MNRVLLTGFFLAIFAATSFAQQLAWYQNGELINGPQFPTSPGRDADLIVPRGFGLELLDDLEVDSLKIQGRTTPQTWVQGNSHSITGALSVQGGGSVALSDLKSVAPDGGRSVLQMPTPGALLLDGDISFDQIVVGGSTEFSVGDLGEVGNVTLRPSDGPRLPNEPLFVLKDNFAQNATDWPVDVRLDGGAVVVDTIDVKGLVDLDTRLKVWPSFRAAAAFGGRVTILTAVAFTPTSRFSGARSLGDGSYLAPFLRGNSLVLQRVIPGDADGSGKVDLSDFGALKAASGKDWDSYRGSAWQNGHFSEWGRTVDWLDFAILKENFGKTGPAPQPDPTQQKLELLVYPDGASYLHNPTSQAVEFDGYGIESTVGGLNPEGWSSIGDRVNSDVLGILGSIGAGGLTFREVDAKSDSLSEAGSNANPESFYSAMLAPSGSFAIGKPFRSVPSALLDSAFHFKLESQAAPIQGEIKYVPEPPTRLLAVLALTYCALWRSRRQRPTFAFLRSAAKQPFGPLPRAPAPRCPSASAMSAAPPGPRSFARLAARSSGSPRAAAIRPASSVQPLAE